MSHPDVQEGECLNPEHITNCNGAYSDCNTPQPAHNPNPNNTDKEIDEILNAMANYYSKASVPRINKAEAKSALNQLIAQHEQAASLSEAKHLEHAMGKRFEQLCRRVETDPNLGNSSKGKKHNFLDGAEAMILEPSLRIKELTTTAANQGASEKPKPQEEVSGKQADKRILKARIDELEFVDERGGVAARLKDLRQELSK